MNDHQVTRRGVLGAVAVSATAGCLSRESGVTLGYVMVSNAREDPVTFVMQVLKDDSRVYENAFDFDRRDGTVIEQPWGDEMAQYTLLSHTEGEESINHFVMPDGFLVEDGQCTDISIMITDRRTDVTVPVSADHDWGHC